MITSRLRLTDPSRRTLLRGAALVGGAGALLGAGLVASSASAQGKFSQQMAKYQSTPKGAARCDNCSQFVPASTCKVVEGPVNVAGWCALYAAKS
jgi:hypothetical protein